MRPIDRRLRAAYGANMTTPAVPSADTAELPVLPDFTRGARTLERMLHAVGARPVWATATVTTPPARSSARPRPAGPLRSLRPERALTGTVIRAVASALLLGIAGSVLLVAVILGISVPLGPTGVALLAVGGVCVLLPALVLGTRLGVQALAVARGRIDIEPAGVRVRGAFADQWVPWSQVRTVSSRTVHPMLGIVAALRLRSGRRIVLPSTTRPLWTLGRPTGQDVEAIRAELARRRRPR